MPDNPWGLPPAPTAPADPYQAPAAPLEMHDPNSRAEAIRREHVRHETSRRSVGVLYWLSAGMLAMAVLAMLFVIPTASRDGDVPVALGIGLLYGAMAVGFGAVGWGYRTLAPWVRWPGGILAALGLLAIPIGTLINGYILYLLFSKKGARIFADDYAEIRRQTPHVKMQRSLLEKILIGLVLGGLLVFLAVLVTGIARNG